MFNGIKRYINRWLDTGSGAYTYTGGGGGSRVMRAGAQTAAGPLINEETALTIPAFLHALRLYGQTLGSLDWDLIEYEGSQRSVARDHPVHRLIHDEPNEDQLPSAWRETMVAHAIAYGNAYSAIIRNGNFRPTALQILLPDRTWPERIHGELKYITIVNGQRKELDQYEVFHITGLSMNGLTGVPLVKLMAETLGLTKAEEQFASAFFGNGCNLGGFLQSPAKLTDAARLNLINSFADDNSGNGNAFRWSVLEEGLTANQIEVDAESTQLVQSRQFQLGDLARIVGLAPHLLYDLSRSTNNNIEHQGIEAVTYSFKPWANKFCQEGNRKLLYECEKGRFATHIDLKPLMMGDSKTQAERDQIRFNCLALTPNEMRASDGKNPIEGGDSLYINTAYLPLAVAIAKAMALPAIPGQQVAPDASGAAGDALEGIDTDTLAATDDAPPASTAKVLNDGPAVPADLLEDANAIGVARSAAILQPIAADVVGRLIRRESKAITNAYQKHSGDKAAFGRWLTQYGAETRQHVAEALSSVCQTVGKLTGAVPDATDIALRWVAETGADVSKVAGPDDLCLMIEGWQGNRAECIVKELLGESNEV